MVSHDPESARVADRIVRIRDGRLAEAWSRRRGGPESIVVGRGGWLRLPEELLRAAGIGERAAAALEGGRIVVRATGEGGEAAPAAAPEAPATASAGAPAASARGLVKRYGSQAVLAGLDVEFATGRLHALTGPSGSGKTTLLHLLAGLELPDGGSVTVDGVELAALDRAGRASLPRRSIGYVGQQAASSRTFRRSRTLSSGSRCAVSATVGRRRSRRSKPSGSAGAAASASRGSPRGSARGWRSPAPSPSGRCSCSQTSRRVGSTARTRSRSRCCSPASRASMGPRRLRDPRPSRDRAGRRGARPGGAGVAWYVRPAPRDQPTPGGSPAHGDGGGRAGAALAAGAEWVVPLVRVFNAMNSGLHAIRAEELANGALVPGSGASNTVLTDTLAGFVDCAQARCRRRLPPRCGCRRSTAR